LLIRTCGEDDSFMKLWAWDEKNLPSITHAIRTAVAATASVIIARLVQMPEAYWRSHRNLGCHAIYAWRDIDALDRADRRYRRGCVGWSARGKLLRANLVAYAVAIFLVGLLSFAFRLEKTAYRYASITLTIIVLITRRRGRSLCIESLKSRSESSLLWRLWRCGQNINGLHPIAQPNSPLE
jgi:hypothetical protein